MKTGIEIISEERKRQINKEGYTPEHDDQYTDGQLAEAASVYAGFATSIMHFIEEIYTNNKRVAKAASIVEKTDAAVLVPKIHRWPFEKKYYKPSPDNRIKELGKAGALIAAEIDRLQRIKEQEISYV